MNKAAVGGLGLFCLVSAGSLFGRTLWLFELLTHFRLQYVIAGAILAVTLVALRRWFGAGIAAILAVANAAPLVPYLDTPPAISAPESGEAVKVMAVNLRHSYGDMDATRRLIRAERPDVVLLTEFLPAHEPALEALGDILPHRVGTKPNGIFDATLLSRLPIARSRIHFPSARFLPVIEARLCRERDGEGTCFTVIGLHSPRPEFRRGRAQVRTFDQVAALAAAVANRRVVVIGDLNTTPFSHRFQDLMSRGGLADAAPGATFRTTWISRFPPFGLTLDHVLVGAGLRPLARRVTDSIGSDHYPLIVDLAIDRPAPAAARR